MWHFLVIQGHLAFNDGKYRDAKEFYSAALEVLCFMPDSDEICAVMLELFCRRAECHLHLDENEEALNDSLAANNILSDQSGSDQAAYVFYVLTKAQERLGNVPNAFVFSILYMHFDPEGQRDRCAVERLREKLTELIYKQEKHDIILICLIEDGKQLLHEEQYEVAMNIFTEIKQLFSFLNLPGVLLLRACCLLKMGKIVEAREQCGEVLHRNPNHEDALALMEDIAKQDIKIKKASEPLPKIKKTEKPSATEDLKPSSSSLKEKEREKENEKEKEKEKGKEKSKPDKDDENAAGKPLKDCKAKESKSVSGPSPSKSVQKAQGSDSQKKPTEKTEDKKGRTGNKRKIKIEVEIPRSVPPEILELIRLAINSMDDQEFEKAAEILKLVFFLLLETWDIEEKSMASLAAELLLKHAECLIEMQFYEKAKEECLGALNLVGDNSQLMPYVLCLMARIHELLGRLANALSFCFWYRTKDAKMKRDPRMLERIKNRITKTIQKGPSHSDHMQEELIKEGVFWLKHDKDPNVAAAIFSEIIDIFSIGEAFFWRAICYKEMKDYDKALQDCLKVLQHDPSSFPVQELWCEILEESRKKPDPAKQVIVEKISPKKSSSGKGKSQPNGRQTEAKCEKVTTCLKSAKDENKLKETESIAGSSLKKEGKKEKVATCFKLVESENKLKETESSADSSLKKSERKKKNKKKKPKKKKKSNLKQVKATGGSLKTTENQTNESSDCEKVESETENEEPQEDAVQTKEQFTEIDSISWEKTGAKPKVLGNPGKLENAQQMKEQITEIAPESFPFKKPKGLGNEEDQKCIGQMKEQDTGTELFSWEKTGAKPKIFCNEDMQDHKEQTNHQVTEAKLFSWEKAGAKKKKKKKTKSRQNEQTEGKLQQKQVEEEDIPSLSAVKGTEVVKLKPLEPILVCSKDGTSQSVFHAEERKTAVNETESIAIEVDNPTSKDRQPIQTALLTSNVETMVAPQQAEGTSSLHSKTLSDLYNFFPSVAMQGTAATKENRQFCIEQDRHSRGDFKTFSSSNQRAWSTGEMTERTSRKQTASPNKVSVSTAFETSFSPTRSTIGFQTQSLLTNSSSPYEIRMVCQHFSREASMEHKVCRGCYSNGQVSFQFRKGRMSVWQRIRPSPPYTKPYELCYHVSSGRQCVVGEKCKFAHGKEELFVWNKLKDEGLQSFLAHGNPKVNEPTQTLQEFNRDKTPYCKMFPPLSNETVSMKPNSYSEKLKGSSDKMTHYTLKNVPPNTIDTEANHEIYKRAPTPNEIFETPGSVMKANPERQQKLPYGIYLACHHFISDSRVKERLCKGCENRGNIFYAFWNKEKKSQQVIRPRPEHVKGQYCLCRHYSSLRTCYAGLGCSFAHGKEELYIWTMLQQRELRSPMLTNLVHELASGNFSQTAVTKPVVPKGAALYKYREPPRRVKNGAYALCKWWKARTTCRFGLGCQFAHGDEELGEWRQRFKDEQQNHAEQKKSEAGPQSVLERIHSFKDMMETLPHVELSCKPSELKVFLSEDKGDNHKYSWMFQVRFKPCVAGPLKTIALLHRYHHHYKIIKVVIGHYPSHGTQQDQYIRCHSIELEKENTIEYILPPMPSLQDAVLVQLKLEFESTIFGSFPQCLLFDFGRETFLVQRMNVDVQGSSDALAELKQIRKDIALQEEMWDDGSVEIVAFQSKQDENAEEKALINAFKLPKRLENIVSAQVIKYELSVDNYKRVLHQLLFAEEMFMRKQLSRFSLKNTVLHAQRMVFSEISGMVCAAEKELFGILKLQYPVIPDASAGRLFRRNVTFVLLRMSQNSENNRVYEARIQQVEEEEDSLVLQLTSSVVKDFELYDGCDVDVDAQFQLNRVPLCEMHLAIERLGPGHLNMLFPQQRKLPPKPVVPFRLDWLLDSRLNSNQRKVISAIVYQNSVYPLVVFGPFGTGKTFTLSQAVRQLVSDSRNRVLLCTHSNRAADKHVELLHDYLTKKNGIKAAKPLRIFEPSRRIETTTEIVRKYSLVDKGKFVLPTRDDVLKNRVVVTTLSTSRILFDLKLGHGFFSHILIDEAAQALEPETVTPVVLAGPNTRVVFTGDHMQMCPEIYSKYARKWGLEQSLPERLFDCYQATQNERFKDAHVMFLTENYRCTKDILSFPSDNFYGEKLLCKSNELAHPRKSPLLFFAARGLEKKEQDHSYLNSAEVLEVIKRVTELTDDWPNVWGPKDLKQIAVFAAYRLQVQAIRAAFRKERKKDVTVDTIHNAQGDEFRAVFITTVRTASTCKPMEESVKAVEPDAKLYFEFLSDPKLMNTAITRAKSLVAVVGDPVALCTVGDCQTLWKDYIRRCNEKGGLYGIEMNQLEKEIAHSFKKTQLNPDAAAFVPSGNAENPGIPQENGQNQTESETAEQSGMLSENQEKPVESTSETEHQAKDSKEERQEVGIEQKSSELDDDDDDNDDESEICSEIDPSYVQECYDDDVTVSPFYMDEIIKAFVRKCEETLREEEEEKSMFENEEFPPLEASTVVSCKRRTQRPQGVSAVASSSQMMSSPDYEIRQVNGRTVIRLINLGFKTAETRQAMASSNYQEYLDPEILYRLLREEPSNHIACSLRISPDRTAYAEVHDTTTPDIQIKGNVRQAFDRDIVVIETFIAKDVDDSRSVSPKGKVVGVLEHVINHRERQYVCFADLENGALMEPINKSVTRIVALTDQSCPDLPIYKQDVGAGRATKVHMMKREKVLSGNYLFLVQLLQWRADCRYPLGIPVKAIKIGDDFSTNLEIIFAEHGVKRGFREEVLKEVERKYPSTWRIPDNECCLRGNILDRVFTVDSSTSKDLDDALSIQVLNDSCYKVGIHISDVSFFVQPNTELDREARSRCTSYYPPSTKRSEDVSYPEYDEEDGGYTKTCIPMLPPQLSENLCSLHPNEERLAVSVFVTLNDNGEIVDECEIRRTIVRSCCRLDYTTVQNIIVGADGETVANVADSVKEDVLILSSLAQKRRRKRLGDAALSRFVDPEDGAEARGMVEEMMILANSTVAKCLMESMPHIAPLRTQLPPKQHRVQEWLQRFKSIVDSSVALPGYIEHAGVKGSFINEESEDNPVIIQEHIWSSICMHVKEGDISRVEQLLCDERNHPQFAVAHAHWRRIQSKSQYVCGGDQSQENLCHASLGNREQPYYTHFTSPIRRYCDILVHRLLIIILAHETNLDERYLQEDVSKLCRRLTFFSDNCRKLDKECNRAVLANRLRERSYTTRTFVDSIDDRSITLHVADPTVDHLIGKQKRLQFSQLGPVMKVERSECTAGTTLKWRITCHLAPSLGKDDGVADSKQDSSALKKIFLTNSKGAGTIHFQRRSWMEVLRALKLEDRTDLAQAINGLEQVHPSLTVKKSEDFVGKSTVYKHPHATELGRQQAPQEIEDDNCIYEKTLTIKQFDVLQIQLSTHTVQGLISPDIQLLYLTPNLTICLEHHRYPRECFATVARHQASRPKYNSIEQYIGMWRPIVAVEAASNAVTQNDGFLLKGISVKWGKDNEVKKKLQACFVLPTRYIKTYQLDFFPGDFACLCVANEDVFDSNPHTFNRPAATKAAALQGPEQEPILFQDKWVCHCIVESVEHVNNEVTVMTLNFHQAASRMPKILHDAKFRCFDVEIIHRSLPHRTVYDVLVNRLRDADSLVHSICKGTDPRDGCVKNVRVPGNLSIRKTSFPSLNRYQEEAVRAALVKPLTLIQGPPGTGKTLTGVHIAYWFVMRNRELVEVPPRPTSKGSDSDDEKLNDEDLNDENLDDENSDDEDISMPSAPPQVMYCGPSNKSVDVVVKYLLKVLPAQNILRIYSSQYEETEFPIPNKIKPQWGKGEDQIEMSDEAKMVALHRVIRRDSPQAQELKQMEQAFEEAAKRGERTSEGEVNEYRKLIKKATQWAIQASGAEVILCTCVVAGGNRVTKYCDNVQQCIVDECGMSTEPETLVPITCSGARQVVLIGDHKQLQPVIQDSVARSLGLEVSMFERLSNKAVMLELQYRMHLAICEFPSRHFYEGRLKTADSVKERDPGPVRFWPSLRSRGKFLPIVFCHVEGEEQSTAISSSQSSEDSKSNQKEVLKAVQVAKYLVVRHNKRITRKDVVIISPYREQRSKLAEQLKGAFDGIEVTTVAKSQGTEWDYVIISLVRSLPEDEIDPEPSLQWLRIHLGFVTDQHQMNVALTRARKGLCIIGNKKLLRVDKMWKKLIEYYEDNGCVVDEDEWPS